MQPREEERTSVPPPRSLSIQTPPPRPSAKRRTCASLLGDVVAVARLAPALGYELPQDGLDFVFVLVLRDAARNDNVADISAFARAT